MAGQVTLEGFTKLQKKFKDLIEVLDGRELLKAMMKPARSLRNEIKRRASRGPTGNLKRSPVAKRFRRKVRGEPAVFVAIDRKIAPHAHLVEFGTVRMAAKPFFRPTYDRMQSGLVGIMGKEAWKIISKEGNK